ncbi:MAG: hypothetical protein JWQ38_2391 [Flavipsychrobacter sp.]|nr:hypothetical protein [Flavipsychrobacter sp.]
MTDKKLLTKYHQEVLARVKAASTIPEHRIAFRQGYSFAKEPFETQLTIWHYIWKATDNIYAQIHAFFFLEQHMKNVKLHSIIWDTCVSWQEEVTDWPLSDSLSKINTRILEQYPEQVYTQLATWNKDSDLWKRRQSLVSLLYYTRTKKVYLPYKKIEALLAPLLTDKEYYVQKGVGWTLRELNNIYPKLTYAFLQKNIKSISPIAFTIAMEKMNEEEKKALKAIRK